MHDCINIISSPSDGFMTIILDESAIDVLFSLVVGNRGNMTMVQLIHRVIEVSKLLAFSLPTENSL